MLLALCNWFQRRFPRLISTCRFSRAEWLVTLHLAPFLLLLFHHFTYHSIAMSAWETPRRHDVPHLVPATTVARTPFPRHDAATTRHLFATGYSTIQPTTVLPLQLIWLSPFGAYCRGCKRPISSARGQLRAHLLTHQDLYFSKYSVDDFTQFVVREVSKLRSKPDLSDFLTGDTVPGYACLRCEKTFLRKDNAIRHSKGKRSVCSLGDIVTQYTGIFYLYHGVGLGCDLRHSACDMIWMRLESLNVPHSSMWHDLAFMVPVSSMCEDPVLKMFLIRYMCWHMHCTIFWIFIHLKPTYEVGHATVFTNQVGHATFIN